MFFFSKKKPFLKDLIPDGFTDIHSHVLPGIDDGAKTDDDTIRLTDELKNLGCTKLIATPHIMYGVWENTPETINLKLSETREKLSTGIRIEAAAEYMLDSNFSKMLGNEKLLTLKDDYLLVEMSYLNPPLHLHELIFEIQLAGYVPVLAHPERYAFYHKNFDELKKLKHTGCKFQLNLLSVVDYYGPHVSETSRKLLKEGLIDFVGSDVHHMKHVRNFDRRIVVKDNLPLREAIARNSLFT